MSLLAKLGLVNERFNGKISRARRAWCLSLWSRCATIPISSRIISISSKRVRVSHFSPSPKSPSLTLLISSVHFPNQFLFFCFVILELELELEFSLFFFHSWKFLDFRITSYRCVIEAKNCQQLEEEKLEGVCVWGEWSGSSGGRSGWGFRYSLEVEVKSRRRWALLGSSSASLLVTELLAKLVC